MTAENPMYRDVSIGAVYATLGRLADKGFVSFRVSDPELVRGGRARKLVSLTPAGLRALRRTADEIARMLDGTPLRPVIVTRIARDTNVAGSI